MNPCWYGDNTFYGYVNTAVGLQLVTSFELPNFNTGQILLIFQKSEQVRNDKLKNINKDDIKSYDAVCMPDLKSFKAKR